MCACSVNISFSICAGIRSQCWRPSDVVQGGDNARPGMVCSHYMYDMMIHQILSTCLHPFLFNKVIKIVYFILESFLFVISSLILIKKFFQIKVIAQFDLILVPSMGMNWRSRWKQCPSGWKTEKLKVWVGRIWTWVWSICHRRDGFCLGFPTRWIPCVNDYFYLTWDDVYPRMNLCRFSRKWALTCTQKLLFFLVFCQFLPRRYLKWFHQLVRYL